MTALRPVVVSLESQFRFDPSSSYVFRSRRSSTFTLSGSFSCYSTASNLCRNLFQSREQSRAERGLEIIFSWPDQLSITQVTTKRAFYAVAAILGRPLGAVL